MGIKLAVKSEELRRALRIHQALKELRDKPSILAHRAGGRSYPTRRVAVELVSSTGIHQSHLFAEFSVEVFSDDQLARFYDALDKHLVPLRKEIEQILSDALEEMGYEIE